MKPDRDTRELIEDIEVLTFVHEVQMLSSNLLEASGEGPEIMLVLAARLVQCHASMFEIPIDEVAATIVRDAKHLDQVLPAHLRAPE